VSTIEKAIWVEGDSEVEVDGDIEIIDYQLVVRAEHEGAVATKGKELHLWDREVLTVEIVLIWHCD